VLNIDLMVDVSCYFSVNTLEQCGSNGVYLTSIGFVSMAGESAVVRRNKMSHPEILWAEKIALFGSSRLLFG
jgi:hypothetical protein